MKIFRKILIIALAIILLSVSFSGCGYTSSYVAVGFVHSNTSHSASMSFYQFKGRMVFTLRCTGSDEGRLNYTGKLESGEIKVALKQGSEMTGLFVLKDGDEVDSFVENIGTGVIYIFVESADKSMNGSLKFDLV
ncbi:MAG: hypothetical protein J5950_02300 [Clostridia bacterium]|nr:hypothetical protein [Clostridia bacterium]